ncbi:3-deoxy-7-phosphoheptulonate synthase [Photobacterium sp. SKA34]|nr:3-deoxy-7-phosphoheptulonate synthase [Photobacterium sp. SKA34]
MHKTDDVRISEIKELLPPVAILEKFSASEAASETVYQARKSIHNILNEEDDRLLVIVGPCSIHDTDAAIEYGKKLKHFEMSLTLI